MLGQEPRLKWQAAHDQRKAKKDMDCQALLESHSFAEG